jgi:hypothetical protein
MYMAYLCFPHSYDGDDEEDTEVEISFVEPSRYMYRKVIPISFNILHEWTDKDRKLYE